jgi:L-ribulose-5-phosphate 4-epimerase
MILLLDTLKKKVLEANQGLKNYGLVKLTWGNVSGLDRVKELMVLKPSGVPYHQLTIDKMVVVDFEENVIEGDLKPSSDTATHLELYRNFPEIEGIVHTHSTWSTIWAQAGNSIPPLGTTHADHFYGEIPCSRKISTEEIENNYERETGNLIVETIASDNPLDVPGVLVRNHGPFTWGISPGKALENSVIMEEVAKMAYYTKGLNTDIDSIDQQLLDKHFQRKHGRDAYYGQ